MFTRYFDIGIIIRNWHADTGNKGETDPVERDPSAGESPEKMAETVR